MITTFAAIAAFFCAVSFFVGYHIRKYKADRAQYLSILRVGDRCRFYRDGYLINARIAGIRPFDRLVITRKGVVSFDKLIMKTNQVSM